jgi:hypothetical protein
MFRRYSPAQGRWISPDPLGVGAVNPGNPGAGPSLMFSAQFSILLALTRLRLPHLSRFWKDAHHGPGYLGSLNEAVNRPETRDSR